METRGPERVDGARGMSARPGDCSPDGGGRANHADRAPRPAGEELKVLCLPRGPGDSGVFSRSAPARRDEAASPPAVHVPARAGGAAGRSRSWTATTRDRRHQDDHGSSIRGRVLAPQVRRRTGAARPGDRGVGPHPYLRSHGRGLPGGRRREGRGRGTSASTASRVGPGGRHPLGGAPDPPRPGCRAMPGQAEPDQNKAKPWVLKARLLEIRGEAGGRHSADARRWGPATAQEVTHRVAHHRPPDRLHTPAQDVRREPGGNRADHRPLQPSGSGKSSRGVKKLRDHSQTSALRADS
jgi:hypothetical protein